MTVSAWLLFGSRCGLRCRLHCGRPMPSVLHVADVYFYMPNEKLMKSASHSIAQLVLLRIAGHRFLQELLMSTGSFH